MNNNTHQINLLAKHAKHVIHIAKITHFSPQIQNVSSTNLILP